MPNSIMVTDLVEKVGCRHLCPVSELIRGRKIDESVHEVPILYRWWFPEDSPIMDLLRNYVESSQPEDFQMKYLLEHGLRKIEIGNKSYCALYVGKSENGKGRFLHHLRGPEKHSTLRKTIRAILSPRHEEKINKERINKVLSDCYYEWTELLEEDGMMIDSFEVMAIAIGYYPLTFPKISRQFLAVFS